jgi:hypothetical protein
LLQNYFGHAYLAITCEFLGLGSDFLKSSDDFIAIPNFEPVPFSEDELSELTPKKNDGGYCYIMKNDLFPGIYKLEDGVCCMIDNGVVTSESGFTLNVNGLGAKPVYTNLAAATRDTTIFNINYTMLFVYDETRVSGGCWVCYRGYDANTNTIGYQVRSNSHSLPAS